MGDEPRFSEKWDFRRKENDFEDSSSDDPDSNSTQDPIIHNPNLEPKQMDTGTKTVTREQPEEKSSEIAHNGRDLDCTAGPLDRFLESGQEMNTPKEKSPEIAQSGGGFDCNGRPLDRFLQSGQGGLGRNYFQQQQEGQGALVAQTEMDYSKNETVKSQKSIVLAIQAPNVSKKLKKTSEANTNKNRSSMVERAGPEMQKDHNFVTPFASQLSSSSSLQSFPVPSSLFPKMSSPSLLQSFPEPPSLFASSSQGITPLASNTNFQMRQPVAQTPDLSEFQTGVTGGQGFENSLFHNNGYFSGFSAAFQPNLMAGSYNFPAQLNSATSSQQRDDNNMFGGLMMAGGAIRFSGNRFPEVEVSNGNNGLSDYRTSSGR